MSNEIQKTEPAKSKLTIRGILTGEEFKKQIANALPSHLKPDRFVRIALTALTRTPQLLECTPESFFKCLLELSAYGLEADGRRAHLIPFKKNRGKPNEVTECTLIIDWKGLAELVMRSNLVSYLHADLVRRGDLFEYSAGQLKNHVPHFLRNDDKKPADAGDVFAVYALAEMKDGGRKVEVMDVSEVLKIRDSSQGYQAFKKGWVFSSPWENAEGEMMKKTAFRRLSKWLPLSPEIRDVVERDDDDTRFNGAHTIQIDTTGPSKAAAILAAKSDTVTETPTATPTTPPEAAKEEKQADVQEPDKDSLVKQIKPFMDGPKGAVKRILERYSLTTENWHEASAEMLTGVLADFTVANQ